MKRWEAMLAGHLPGVIVILAVAVVVGTACTPSGGPALGPGGTGGASAPGGSSSGGAPAMGGAGGTTTADAGISTGGAGGAGGAVASCEQSPPPLRQTGTMLELPVDLVFDDKPFVFGETNAVSSTADVLPLNLRFYLSRIELLTTNGGSVPVDIVTATGDVSPYGVFFFNAEDAAMQTLRVRAPAGTYTGLKVELGLGVACNKGFADARAYPLSSDSQMSWPHLFGYLFLRYEGRVTTSDETARASLPPAVHLGADIRNLDVPGALVFRIAGALTIPAAGGPVTKHLRLAMDQVLKGATAAVDLSDFPFVFMPEVAAGERLRRTGADLPLFVFGP